jgi:hypothetical protein
MKTLIPLVVVFCAQIALGQMVPPTSIEKRANKSIMLLEDFEDGNLFGWYQFLSGSCYAIVSGVAANGNYSMQVIGECGQWGGFYRDFPDFRATNISINVMPGSGTFHNAYVILGEHTINGTKDVIFFYASMAGRWALAHPSGFSIDCGMYTPDQWHNITLGINWTTQRITVWVDGVEKTQLGEFIDSSATTLNRIILKNMTGGYARYDDITMSNPPPQPPIFVDGFETGDFSNWSGVQP